MQIDGCHISINKGDTGVIRFVFSRKRHKIPVGQRNFRFIIKKHREELDSSAIMDETKQGDSVDVNYVAFAIPATVTDNESGSYFWGLRVVNSGQVSTLQEGLFTIERGTFH